VSDEFIKIGDVVWWRGAYGRQLGRLARVVDLTKTAAPKDKFGERVNWALWELVEANRILATVTPIDDDGQPIHWAYGFQLRRYSK